MKKFLQRLRLRFLGRLDVAWYRAHGTTIGTRPSLGANSWIDPADAFLVMLGDDVVFGPRVTVLAHDASMRRRKGFTKLAPVTIGSRVFVGANSTIMPGVTIGDDCVIGACSVVTKNIPSGSVAAGNPARVIRTVAELEEKFDREFERGKRYNEAAPGRGFPDGSEWAKVRAEITDVGYGWDS